MCNIYEVDFSVNISIEGKEKRRGMNRGKNVEEEERYGNFREKMF